MMGWRAAALLALATIVALSPVSRAAPHPVVEVMHWLTADRDTLALKSLREAFVARGGVWRDTPMPGAGEVGRAAAVNRIVGGKPPAVFQFALGAQLDQLGAQGMVGSLPLDASGLDAVLPAAVATVSKYRGRYIAAPLDVRGENWMFYNGDVLRAAGVAVPRSWPDFLAAAAKIKARGKIPIALGGQPWQERFLFDDVLLGVGGPAFYRRVFVSLDPAAFSSPTMLAVFRTFAALRDDVDAASPGRRWSQATLMLVHGDAAFQFMGDWAKNKLYAAGVAPGGRIGCALAPAASESYVMTVDAFVFSPPPDAETAAGQRLMAQTILDPSVQAEFARRLGAIPARLDAPAAGFDACSAHAMTVVRRAGAALLDSGLSLPGGMAGAIDDTISQFWNDRGMPSERGRELLWSTVAANR